MACRSRSLMIAEESSTERSLNRVVICGAVARVIKKAKNASSASATAPMATIRVAPRVLKNAVKSCKATSEAARERRRTGKICPVYGYRAVNGCRGRLHGSLQVWVAVGCALAPLQRRGHGFRFSGFSSGEEEREAVCSFGKSRSPVSFRRSIVQQLPPKRSECAARRAGDAYPIPLPERDCSRQAPQIKTPAARPACAQCGRGDLLAILLDARGAQTGEAVLVDRVLPGQEFLDRQRVARAGFLEGE